MMEILAIEMQVKLPWGVVKSDSPFYAIFEDGLVPLKSAEPVQVTLLDPQMEFVEPCYFLELRRVSLNQLKAICQVFADRTDSRPDEVFASLLNGMPLPVRASSIGKVIWRNVKGGGFSG